MVPSFYYFILKLFLLKYLPMSVDLNVIQHHVVCYRKITYKLTKNSDRDRVWDPSGFEGGWVVHQLGSPGLFE